MNWKKLKATRQRRFTSDFFFHIILTSVKENYELDKLKKTCGRGLRSSQGQALIIRKAILCKACHLKLPRNLQIF